MAYYLTGFGPLGTTPTVLGLTGLGVVVGPVRPAVRALLEEALDGLDRASPLRPRLLARLSVELYHAPPVSRREALSDEALRAARSTGGRALVEALEARHVALWSPEHAETRLEIAAELVATARSLGDREAELQGVNWQVVDLLEVGDGSGARAAIDEHERLAAALRLGAYAWYVPLWRAMLAIAAGRLEDADRLSQEGVRIGQQAQDENAALLFEIQRLAIRQLREGLGRADVERIRA